ncbi:MAG: OPT/YSL family transporter [Opitutales bacterium]|nr:OPT/YSL family transporter [Opitutales bacterium]
MADQSPPPEAPKKTGIENEEFFDAKFSIEAIQNEPYEDGFTWRTIVGAFFISFVMLPGLIFMGLMIGYDMGTAAEWVTIILFVEVARRSFLTLRKQELYMLKYTAGQLTHMAGGISIGGGIFGMLVYFRYLRNSDAFHTFGIAHQVPDWVAPYGDAAYNVFTHPVWYPAIIVTIASMTLSKLTQLSLGFLAYKATADVEKLPFPLAPIAAEGAIALAETSQDKNKRGYRQYCFSLGAIIGAVFGIIYVGVPTLSNAFLDQTLTIIPIPFLDLTTTMERYLPTAPIGITLNLGLIFFGFVLPWRVCMGMVASTFLFQLILNPFVFYPLGWLPTWTPGKSAIQTNVSNALDLYLSMGIGIAFAILCVGLYGMGKSWMKYRNNKDQDEDGFDIKAFWRQDKPRGDVKTWLAIGVYSGVSLIYVIFCNYLVNGNLPPDVEPFPIYWLVLFAYVWTPMNTYINARMSGIAGQHAGIPFVTEGAIFASQHRGVAIWFAPLPIANYGKFADELRETQLTRTKFTSILKAELLAFPLLIIASFIFWSYIVTLGDIPSDRYPFVEQFWPQYATMQGVWASSMQEGQTLLFQSLKLEVIITSFIGSIGLFSGFSAAGLSHQYIYGGITTVTQLPHMAILIFVGALLGRFFFMRKFGKERWTNYTPILAVGFAAGMGLTGMLSIAINFLWASIGASF